jgi:DNA invertase Pin-like site-specific DNA recombinase
MTKKAVAYVSDIILGRTGEIINRDYQKNLIRRYARENGVEILAWFEDEVYQENPLERPGVQALLDCEQDFDMVLVERVWSFSRSWPTLHKILECLEQKRAALEASTTMWDCVSQMCRRRFDDTLVGPTCKRSRVQRKENKKAIMHKPSRLHFDFLMDQRNYAQ